VGEGVQRIGENKVNVFSLMLKIKKGKTEWEASGGQLYIKKKRLFEKSGTVSKAGFAIEGGEAKNLKNKKKT